MNFMAFLICFASLVAAKLLVWLLKKNKRLWHLAFPYGIALMAPLCFAVLLGITATAKNSELCFGFQFSVTAFFTAATIFIGKEKIGRE